MKFTEFLKEYLHDNYGLPFRAFIISIIITQLPISRSGTQMLTERIIYFVIVFIAYIILDIFFEWIKVCRENK